MNISNNIDSELKKKKDREKRKEENKKRREEDDIHERVKYFREKADMEQIDLAVLAGCSKEYICKIERKKADPGHSLIKRIIKVLKVSVCEFYTTDIPKKEGDVLTAEANSKSVITNK